MSDAKLQELLTQMENPRFAEQVEFVLRFVPDLMKSVIKDGYIDPRGKSEKQVFEEFRKFIGNQPDGMLFIADHTRDILNSARAYHRKKKYEMACVLYATWLEHHLNGIVLAIGRRVPLPKKQIEVLIRDTNLKAKYLWMHVFFAKKAPQTIHLERINRLTDRRNQFVHYKWKPMPKESQNEFKLALEGFNRTIKHLEDFEDRYLLHHFKSKFEARGTT